MSYQPLVFQSNVSALSWKNLESFYSCFAVGTKVLTEFGLMNVEDIFNSSETIKLISYNEKLQKFEPKSILDKSKKTTLTNKYSFSQTRRRLENTITCTPDHPFATYQQGILSYIPIENLILSPGGAIIPTNINIHSNLSLEEQDPNFYYLLGVILSDGTIYRKKYKNSPSLKNRPRNGKYIQSYIRIYQSTASHKQPFIQHLKRLFKSYSIKINTRTEPPRNSNFRGRIIKGNGLVELTITNQGFVDKIRQILSTLPNILLNNPALSINFLAGYLDGDGSYSKNKGVMSISIGKKEMFSIIICTLLSLGIAYKVYRNRTNYLIEFRENNVLKKLSAICQRVNIDNPPPRVYSDKLVLANSIIGGILNCKNLTTMAKQKKLIDIHKFKGQSLDLTLTMNRVFKVESDLKNPVYNFTVEDNNNYIVFTEYYTPVLVHNCAHGAGRVMSRTKAKKTFTLDDLIKQTKGVECRKDTNLIDEIPGAYKPIEQVMKNQNDLVQVVATLKQVICVKG